MSRRLDDTSRDILEFRPDIGYVEPDVEPGLIRPIEVEENPRTIEEVQKEVEEVKKLANAVDVLATAMQARADKKAKDVVIKLDPKIDSPIVAAMRRRFPDDSPQEITYAQYRDCKDAQRERGIALVHKGLIPPEDIQKERDKINLGGSDTSGSANKANLFGQPGMFGTEAARTGGLRPELNEKAQVVEPLDVDEFQDLLLRMLINLLWKLFIKPAIPLPPGVGLALIPDEIAPIPKGTKSEQFYLKSQESSKGQIQQAQNSPHPAEIAKQIDTGSTTGGGITKPGSVSTSDPIQQPNAFPTIPSLPTDTSVLSEQDCHAITRAFERGANYCATEESVFAVMTPLLNNMRIMAKAFGAQMDTNEVLLDGTLNVDSSALTDEQSTGTDSAYLANQDVGLVEDSGGSGSSKKGPAEILADWVTDCIPCDFRISFGGNFFVRLWDNLQAAIGRYKDMFKSLLDQLLGLAKLWDMDIQRQQVCALIAFFQKFVCLPDLRRIIAALMALLMRVSFELNSIFSLILTLVAPLVIPFLMGIINTIEQYALAVLEPLFCVIDSLIAMVQKFDYSEIFSAGDLFNFNYKLGAHGEDLGTSDGVGFNMKTPEINLPYMDKVIPIDLTQNPPDVHAQALTGGDRGKAVDWSTASKVGGLTKGNLNPFDKITQDEDEALRKANEELDKVREKRGYVDFSDNQQRDAYSKELEQARAKRDQAVKKRSTTYNQRAQEFLAGWRTDVESLILTLVEYIREAIAAVQGFIADLTGEFKKLLEGMMGGGNDVMLSLFKKLEIVQLISMLTALINWLLGRIDCNDEEEENFDVQALISNRQDIQVWTDSDGTVHIQESDETVDDALDEAIKVIGTDSGGIGSDGPISDAVGTGSDNQPRQKLKSLIEFTGDPVLDTEIARVIDTVTTPSSDVFRCPLQTSVAEAEQVNTWIRELNTT